MRHSLCVLLIVFSAAACEDSMPVGPTTPVASINFFYESIIPPDTPPDPDSVDCVSGILPLTIHIKSGWTGYRVIDMSVSPDGAGYRGVSANVPIDTLNTLIMIDPDVCNVDRTTAGAVTERISANGVLLTNVVRVSSQSNRSGLTFRVSADGTVTP